MSFCFYFYFKDANCPISNFYPSAFTLDGGRWPTVEHYFEAMKVLDPRVRDRIARAESPAFAKAISRSAPVRPDWEKIQDGVMRKALSAKFRQNAECLQFLLDSGDTQLVENAPWDYYWGCGATGEGRNRLGELLMELRAQFMQEAATTVARYGDVVASLSPSALGGDRASLLIGPPVPDPYTPAPSPSHPRGLSKAEAA